MSMQTRLRCMNPQIRRDIRHPISALGLGFQIVAGSVGQGWAPALSCDLNEFVRVVGCTIAQSDSTRLRYQSTIKSNLARNSRT